MLIYAVDDDPTNLKLISAILAQNGFKSVQTFRTGQSLMEQIKLQRPDLLLLDIMMPGMSGFDVLEELAVYEPTRDLPVIMITAATIHDENMEALRHSFELGATDYISKPFSHVELRMRVLSALRLEKRRQELVKAGQTIQSLEKLLPICAYCKKVRNDDDYWQDVEVYISEHTDTAFSHSICPNCYETHVKPQLDSLKRKK